MSYADKIFVETCKDILANGFSDKDLHVRPRWEDGTPAHTIKKFGVVNRYDLKNSSLSSPSAAPIGSPRSTKCFGFGRRSLTTCRTFLPTFGTPGQMRPVLSARRTAIRWALSITTRTATTTRSIECSKAYSMTFNVLGNTLNAILNQRSQDMTTSVRGSIFLTSTRCPMPLSARTGTLWGTGCRRWWRPAEGLLASAFQRPLSHESQCRYCSSRALSITN